MSAAVLGAPAEVTSAIASVADPEVPVVTIHDLGILRSITVEGDTVRVVITPTYSGCPAMEVIRERVVHAARTCGYAAEVTMQLSPAWTTDWMTPNGREALSRFGIAPPGPVPAGPVAVGLSVRQVACPLCGAYETEELSRFGSTSCKALRRCLSCREPFEEFKAI